MSNIKTAFMKSTRCLTPPEALFSTEILNAVDFFSEKKVETAAIFLRHVWEQRGDDRGLNVSVHSHPHS